MAVLSASESGSGRKALSSPKSNSLQAFNLFHVLGLSGPSGSISTASAFLTQVLSVMTIECADCQCWMSEQWDSKDCLLGLGPCHDSSKHNQVLFKLDGDFPPCCWHRYQPRIVQNFALRWFASNRACCTRGPFTLLTGSQLSTNRGNIWKLISP